MLACGYVAPYVFASNVSLGGGSLSGGVHTTASSQRVVVCESAHERLLHVAHIETGGNGKALKYCRATCSRLLERGTLAGAREEGESDKKEDYWDRVRRSSWVGQPVVGVRG